MDSRDATAPPHSAPPNMMVGHHHNSYPTAMSNNHSHSHSHNHNHNHHNHNNASSMIGPNSVGSAQMLGGGGGARFPFNSVTPPPPPPQSASKPLESLSVNPYDGSSPSGLRASVGGSGGGFSIDSGNKKKRGRPRKYSPDGNIALGLSPTPIPSSAAVGSGGHGESGGTTPSSEASGKKHRGRPPGSSKRQLDALGKFEFFWNFRFCIVVQFRFGLSFLVCVFVLFAGAGGVGFTPHVIMVKAGEVFSMFNWCCCCGFSCA